MFGSKSREMFLYDGGDPLGGVTVVNPPTPAPTPAPQADDGINYKDKYFGLKGAFEQEQAKRKEVEGKLGSIFTEREQLSARAEAAERERQAALERAEKIEAEKNAITARISRANETQSLIASKYPELQSDLLNGYLRLDGLEGEALTGYLDRMQARAKSLGEAQTRADLETNPPTPKGPAVPANYTLDDVTAKMMKADPATEEYAALEERYYTLLRG